VGFFTGVLLAILGVFPNTTSLLFRQKKALITPASIDSMARVALNNLESTSLSHSVRVHLIPGGEVRCYRVQYRLPGDCNPETENQTGRQKKQ